MSFNTHIPTSGCNLQPRCCFWFWSIFTSTPRPHARLANNWFTTETCSTSRFCFSLVSFIYISVFTFCYYFFFMFSKTFFCKVNFDLFTKLFLVVGVCWLFQVCFSFWEKNRLISKFTFSLGHSCTIFLCCLDDKI